MNNDLINFYSGIAPDNKGRYLYDIIAWDDERLEKTHDYIQWLFPLEEASMFNPDAPLLDPQTIKMFHESEQLRNNMRAALERMMKFYLLDRMEETQLGKYIFVVPSRYQAKWLSKGNHNYLRLTRILKSLNLCGLPVFADFLMERLEMVYFMESYVIGSETMEYWKDAVGEAPNDAPIDNCIILSG